MAEVKQIDALTLVSWINSKKDFTILDIRSQTEREEWFIPESSYYNAYDQLKAGDVTALDGLELNLNKPVVTLCGKGRLSLFAAEILANKGVETYSLEGGMQAWNNAYDTQEIDFDTFKIIQVRRVAKGCLSYIIGSLSEAIVIDSSLDPSVYKQIAEKENWRVKYVSDTHIHADYVSRTLELTKETNAVHLFNANASVSYPFKAIQDKEIIRLGQTKIEILFTPGHTFESTSFIIEDRAIITGDTLFIDGVGRPDLKADSVAVISKATSLYHSLQKILKLNPEILVMPAHSSTSIFIGQPFIADSLKSIKGTIASLSCSESEFVDSISSKLPPTPPNYLTIAEINQKGNHDGFILPELEAGANRCAIS